MANPVQDPSKQAMAIPGTGYAATLYDDGTIVVWDISTGNGVAQAKAGDQAVDLGNGKAVAFGGDGSPSEAWALPGSEGYQNPGAGPAGAGAGANVAPNGSRVGMPGDDTNSRVGTGRYSGTYGGQTTPGRETDVPFGSTVAPSTWNKASPGRSEGWGTIGAGTEGTQYGYGSSWGKPQIKIDEGNLAHLNDPTVAPGYIPGSASYNQYDLSKPGLFQTLKGPGGKDEVVNSRFGLGGTGDPTTGGEMQTPSRYVTGNPSDSGVSMKGDDKWRSQYGGGGGLLGLAGNYMAGLPAGGGGSGGGENSFFGSTVTSNWGQTDETRGKDYMATLFLRSDTPTGVGTPAYSAPASMWQGLLDEIRAGRVYVKNPEAWKMIQEKTGATPQTIGGSATGGQNVQPGGATGAGGVPATGVSGTFKEGEDTPFGAIKGGLPQGFSEVWHELLQKKAEAEGKQAVEEAKLTGVFNGKTTLEAQKLEADIKDAAEKNAIAKINADANMKQALADEAYKQATAATNQQKVEGDIKKQEADIAAKKQEIEDLKRAGDLDRAQKETESLRLMESKREELSGYINGQATLEREKFQADEQAKAYERAANPARAFENELARGNTGWNAPMAGPWGTTTGLPAQQNALGQGAATQAQGTPGYNYGQPISFGTPGAVTGQPLPGQPGAAPDVSQMTIGADGNITGSPGGTPEQQAQAKAQAAAAYQANAAATGAQAQATPGDQAQIMYEQQAGQTYAGNTTQPGAPGAGQAEGYPAPPTPTQFSGVAGTVDTTGLTPPVTQTPGGGYGYPGTGAPAPNYGYGQSGAAGLGQPGLDQVTVRTPAAVNAFRTGQAMPTAGQYGVASTSGTAATQALSERQVRTQNLKQSRRMAPNARAIVGSYARAGGVDDETQKMYGDRAAPKATAGAGSYAIK